MAVTKPNFGSLLDTNADEIERPKPMPEGSYLWRVTGLPRFDKSSKKQTEFAEFTLTCIAAGEDVDAVELEALGGIKDKTQRATFYITEKSLYRLKEFLQHCGIEVEGRSLREAIEDAPNCEVGAYIRHEASDDGETIYANLGKTFSADAFNENQEAA
jgi:hypothetical protein